MQLLPLGSVLAVRYIRRMSLRAGTRLGTYEIVAPLGAGGMGEVHRAHDTRLGRDVAVKVLPDEVSSSPERMARFEREARIVASLNHPNIITLHSIEEAAGTRFLTMELVEGRSFADLITPGGLPMAQVLDLMIPVADALAAAHERGVVHRDLKPANVMVTREGRVKVLDFGLAKLMSIEPYSQRMETDSMSSPLSTAGEVLGTVPYMAPEQLFGEAVDARTDLFSFGILLFEIVTGQRPFVGKTFWEVTAAIMRETPPLLTSVRTNVPVDLERIVNRCTGEGSARSVPDRTGSRERTPRTQTHPRARRDSSRSRRSRERRLNRSAAVREPQCQRGRRVFLGRPRRRIAQPPGQDQGAPCLGARVIVPLQRQECSDCRSRQSPQRRHDSRR